MSAQTLGDLFALPKAWRKFSVHAETLQLDFTNANGEIVILRGSADAYPDTCRVVVTVLDGLKACGLSRWDASGLLKAAVLDGRIGSDVLREAVEREWSVVTLAANEVAR